MEKEIAELKEQVRTSEKEMIKATGQIATDVVAGLKNSGPLAVPLIVINCAFLGVFTYFLIKINDRVEAKDAMIAQLVKDCRVGPQT